MTEVSPTHDRELPSGLVTFLFTDIEGSTKLVQALGPRYPELLEHQGELIQDSVEAHVGVVFGTEGDAVFAAFADPFAAVEAALAAQHALATHDWPDGIELK